MAHGAANVRIIKGFIKRQKEMMVPEEGLILAIRQINRINRERMLLKNNHKRRNGRQVTADPEPCALRPGIANQRLVNP